MSNFFRAIGNAFGFGEPKVNQAFLAAENRTKINAQGEAQKLEGEADAQRIRAARSGRRAALASQVRDALPAQSTLG